MTNNALEIINLNVKLGHFNLTNINLKVVKGTIMGFVGKNGAGKTTLLKSILDVIPTSSGEVFFDGIPLFGNEEKVKQNIGVVYDSLIYPGNMTGCNIVKMISPFYSKFDLAIWHSLMTRFELNENMKLSSFSKGMQMKFSIAMALAHTPEILLLDEPTAGLDPEARADVLDLLLEFMQDENHTVFFSTHITSDLDKIADYITLIDNGKIIFVEEKEALLDQYALVHIEKEAMTQKLKENLTGIKENVFGYEGLASDKSLFEGQNGVKLGRPCVEDIMIYRGGISDN